MDHSVFNGAIARWLANGNVESTRAEPKTQQERPVEYGFQILDEPAPGYQDLFQIDCDNGRYQVEGRVVNQIGTTTNGDTFVKGSINLETGWVISDLPYGRASGALLWMAREIGGWEDPSGKTLHESRRQQLLTNGDSTEVEGLLSQLEEVKTVLNFLHPQVLNLATSDSSRVQPLSIILQPANESELRTFEQSVNVGDVFFNQRLTHLHFYRTEKDQHVILGSLDIETGVYTSKGEDSPIEVSYTWILAARQMAGWKDLTGLERLLNRIRRGETVIMPEVVRVTNDIKAQAPTPRPNYAPLPRGHRGREQ